MPRWHLRGPFSRRHRVHLHQRMRRGAGLFWRPTPLPGEKVSAVDIQITVEITRQQIHDQTFIDSAAVFAKAFKPIETAS